MLTKICLISTISFILSSTAYSTTVPDISSLTPQLAEEIAQLNIENTPSSKKAFENLQENIEKFLNTLHHSHLDEETQDKLIDALCYAAIHHHEEYRSIQNHPAYLNHALSVTMILIEEGKVEDPVTLQAALLHGILEKHPDLQESLKEEFGSEISGIVKELTLFPQLSMIDNILYELDRCTSLSKKAKVVKLADKISNLRDLRQPPAGWKKERVKRYLLAAEAMLKYLSPSNSKLESIYSSLVEAHLKETS